MKDRSLDQPAAPKGCTQPAKGRLLDGYIERTIPDADRQDFEDHYFLCPACLGELQLREAIRSSGETLAAPMVSRHSLWWGRRAAVWLVPLLLAGGVGGFMAWRALRPPEGPESSARGWVEVRLAPVVRSNASLRAAPKGKPFLLALLVSVPTKARVVYDVEITDSLGKIVLSYTGLPPTGPSEVRVRVAEGLTESGRYSVSLTERDLAGTREAPTHYAFEVGSETR